MQEKTKLELRKDEKVFRALCQAKRLKEVSEGKKKIVFSIISKYEYEHVIAGTKTLTKNKCDKIIEVLGIFPGFLDGEDNFIFNKYIDYLSWGLSGKSLKEYTDILDSYSFIDFWGYKPVSLVYKDEN